MSERVNKLIVEIIQASSIGKFANSHTGKSIYLWNFQYNQTGNISYGLFIHVIYL